MCLTLIGWLEKPDGTNFSFIYFNNFNRGACRQGKGTNSDAKFSGHVKGQFAHFYAMSDRAKTSDPVPNTIHHFTAKDRDSYLIVLSMTLSRLYE